MACRGGNNEGDVLMEYARSIHDDLLNRMHSKLKTEYF